MPMCRLVDVPISRLADFEVNGGERDLLKVENEE